MMDRNALQALGIDASDGLAYCSDDEEFYEEMLAEYVNEQDADRIRLQQFFEARDWENYRIVAHSVKNTSKMIGAHTVSERAYMLELAAKERDEATLLTAHSPFLADYSALVDGIREMMG